MLFIFRKIIDFSCEKLTDRMLEGECMNFFKFLNSKTKVTPGADFDKKFWAAFEREFHSERAGLFDFFSLARFARMAMVPGMAVLIAVGGTFLYQSYRKSPGTDVEVVAELDSSPVGAVEHEPMLKDLDLYLAFDDVSKLTDEDWNELLLPEKET